MYIELIKDNIKIVHALKESDILKAIINLKNTRNQNILMFFCALSVCQNSPVHSHQKFICHELFENHANDEVLYDITYDQEKKIVQIRVEPGKVDLYELKK